MTARTFLKAFAIAFALSGRAKADGIRRFVRVCLAGLLLGFAWLPVAGAATLPNGGHLSGAIVTLGGQDTHTFSANAGENIWLRIADTGNTGFSPTITLYKPDGSYTAYNYGSSVAGITHTATIAGTYTVVVSDGNGSNTGSYNLYFVRVPGANEEGALVNGGYRSGVIDLGDLDTYTFSATAGENIWLRIADTGNTGFTPAIRLYKPDGSYGDYSYGSSVATITHTATVSGTYTVVVSDSNGANTGTYNLYFVRVPGANEEGSLGNGSLRNEQIDLGDLDSYTLGLASGANIQLTLTDTSGSGFTPAIHLYMPDGSFSKYSYGSSAATITHTATVAGTYTVVVSDSNGSNTGTYTLQLTGTGITSGDVPGEEPGVGSDGDVPLPAWALALLGAGLLGAMRRRAAA